MNKTILASLLVVVATFIAGIYFYPSMPDMIASHWGASGQVNGHMSKFWGLFLVPLMTLAIFGFFLLLPKIDPLKSNYAKFKKYYDGFLLAFVAFMAYIYGLTILWNVGIEFDMTMAIIPAMAALFYLIGIVLENSKQNWFIGIRTPWTMSNEMVWDKTNKLGGRIFKIFAVAIMVALFLGERALVAVVVLLVAGSLYTIIYSYLIYRRTVK